MNAETTLYRLISVFCRNNYSKLHVVAKGFDGVSNLKLYYTKNSSNVVDVYATCTTSATYKQLSAFVKASNNVTVDMTLTDVDVSSMNEITIA